MACISGADTKVSKSTYLYSTSSTILNPANSTGTSKKMMRCSGDDQFMIIVSSGYEFVGVKDDTKLYRLGEVIATYDKQEIVTVTLNAGDIIYSNNPISFTKTDLGFTGLCYAWAGTQFAIRFSRYFISLVFTATEKNASVTIYKGNAQTVVYSDTVAVDELASYDIGEEWDTYIIESDQPICVYGGGIPSAGGGGDMLPLYPTDTELYGTTSTAGYFVSTYTNTTTTELLSDGTSTTSGLISRGSHFQLTNTGSHYIGESAKLTADHPIGASSAGDGDGGDITPYVAKCAFGTQFTIPEDQRDFVKIVSDIPTNIRVFSADGRLIHRKVLHGNGPYRIRLDEENSYESVYIETDDPVYCIFESAGNDETVLHSHTDKNIAACIKPVINNGKVLPIPFKQHGVNRDTTSFEFGGGGNTYVPFDDFYSDQLNAFTFNVWFKSNTPDIFQSIVYASNDVGGQRNIRCVVNSANSLYVQHNAEQSFIMQNITANTWWNFIYSYDGAGNGDCYVNGNFIKTQAVPAGSPTREKLMLGTASNITTRKFYGYIDDFILYEEYLSGTDVKKLYNSLRKKYE